MVIITFEMCADYFTGSQAKIIKKKTLRNKLLTHFKIQAKVCKAFIKNTQETNFTTFYLIFLTNAAF